MLSRIRSLESAWAVSRRGTEAADEERPTPASEAFFALYETIAPRYPRTTEPDRPASLKETTTLPTKKAAC
jgi:hypothetical protein